jgi:hypothetical protein
VNHACTRHPPSATCYRRHGCRCSGCDADFKRRKKLSRNGMCGMVDAEPVRKHIIALQSRGYGTAGIATAAGVGNQLIEYALTTARKVHRDTARKILAVTEPAGLVDVTGTRRRLQALAALGWTFSDMSERLGYSRAAVHHWTRAGRVSQSTAGIVRRLYDELWDQPPPTGMGAKRNRAAAEQKGWWPPMCWDDDAIDNPDATPHPETARQVWGATLENIEWMADSGELLPGIAARLGIAEQSVRDVLRRSGRSNLLARIAPDLNPISRNGIPRGRVA